MYFMYMYFTLYSYNEVRGKENVIKKNNNEEKIHSQYLLKKVPQP